MALFLRRLSDQNDGYPVTLRGCNQSMVQEGHFFQHIAMAYDMILDSGFLTDADRAQIEATFRVFMQSIDRENQEAWGWIQAVDFYNLKSRRRGWRREDLPPAARRMGSKAASEPSTFIW